MSLKKRLRDNHNEVDAGPLNDVLFILLMFFLLVSTLANPNVVKVSNPKGKSDTKVSQNIVVSITNDQKVFIGVIDVLNPRIETPAEVCEMILEAADVIPVSQLGTTDDCGFSPFADDTSTSRETAFAKIRARIQGTAMAENKLSK